MNNNLIKKALVVLSLLLSVVFITGCNINNSSKNIIAFATVHYGSEYSVNKDKIIFGNNISSNASVYHYNQKKNTIQLQPTKTGNIINNIDRDWEDIKSIESIGHQEVYHEVPGKYYQTNYELINEKVIEVFKITQHITYAFTSSIEIREIYVINVEDIEAFEFEYKIKELEWVAFNFN